MILVCLFLALAKTAMFFRNIRTIISCTTQAAGKEKPPLESIQIDGWG